MAIGHIAVPWSSKGSPGGKHIIIEASVLLCILNQFFKDIFEPVTPGILHSLGDFLSATEPTHQKQSPAQSPR